MVGQIEKAEEYIEKNSLRDVKEDGSLELIPLNCEL